MKKQRCLCHQCTYWTPLQEEIMDALPDSLKKKFDHLWESFDCVQIDLDVAQAKLRGDWPGWEWMKKAVRAAECAAKEPEAELYYEELPK